MTGPFQPEDLAAVRQEGSLAELFAHLTGKPPRQPEPPAEETGPRYHIARPGAWPCGTASSGPSPGPRCSKCSPCREDKESQ